MSSQVPMIPFVLLAAATLAGTLAIVLSRNVLHAAFWALEVMIAVAGLFLLLSAEFLALVQLMVYAGAVSVLILFTIMITLRRRQDAIRPLDFSATALGISVAFAVASAGALAAFQDKSVAMPKVTPGAFDFGQLLFTQWALPFEIASVILLIALVGAVLWAGGEEGR